VLRWIHPGDFVRGLLYPVRGLEILRRHGGLRRYWVPPILLTALSLIVSLTFAVRYHDDALAMIWQVPAGEGWVAGLLGALHWVLRVLALVLGFAVSVVLTIALANVIAAPFNDALSEQVELRETGQPSAAFSLSRVLRDVGRTLRIELTKLLVYVAVLGPLFVLSWLFPGPGQLAYTVFASLFTVVYLALDYIDWPASRRGYGMRQRIAMLKVRPMLTLGFGAAVAVCLFVPLLNLLFMPLAVAGGTRLFLDLTEYGERASRVQSAAGRSPLP
jgi:CysZ protein